MKQFVKLFDVLADRFVDSGYPYFYKARRVKRPFLLRNYIMGKILAGYFMFPVALGMSMQMRFKAKDPLTYESAFNNTLLKRDPTEDPSERWDVEVKKALRSDFKRNEAIQRVDYEISLWYWNDQRTKENDGKPIVSLQYTPTELEVTTSSQLKSVGVVGRNYPLYHYTGGEETLSFDIDWHDDSVNEQISTLRKCRLLEALSKADGYSGGPPYITIEWSEFPHYRKADKKLLDNHVYVIQSADYKMSEFVYYRWKAYTDDKVPAINGMFPTQITQKLVLKRVAGQLTHKQIVDGTVSKK